MRQLLSHPHIEIPRKLLPLQTARVLSFLRIWPIRLTKLLKTTEKKINEGSVLCRFLPFVCLRLLNDFYITLTFLLVFMTTEQSLLVMKKTRKI